MRTTKNEVEAVFERLCHTAGIVPFIDRAAGAPNTTPSGMKRPQRLRHEPDGTLHHNAGWSLDYSPTYGGYIIAGHSGNGTGESRPMGEYRMPAGEFVRAMHMAIRAMDIVKSR